MGSATHNHGGGNNPAGWMTMDFHPTFYSQFALGYQFLPDGAKAVILLCKLVLNQFLSFFSLPLEVCLRWRWGARTLALYQVWFLMCVAFFGGFMGPTLAAFFLAAAGFSLWHYIEARLWEARPDAPWRMTYSWGEPKVCMWLFGKLSPRVRIPDWLASEGAIFRFAEPAIGLIGLPLLVLPFTQALGLALLFGGTALLVKRHLIYLRMVGATRDRRDAVVIGQLLSETADSEREIREAAPAFEVRLAPLLSIPSPDPPALPAPAPAIATRPSGVPEARIVAGPDANGSLKVECPGCRAKIRCRSNHEAGASCPGCKTAFVFTVPQDVVG
jgi:hypothetical protein